MTIVSLIYATSFVCYIVKYQLHLWKLCHKKKINFAVGMYSMKFLIKFGGFPVALEMKTLTPRVEKLHVCLFVCFMTAWKVAGNQEGEDKKLIKPIKPVVKLERVPPSLKLHSSDEILLVKQNVARKCSIWFQPVSCNGLLNCLARRFQMPSSVKCYLSLGLTGAFKKQVSAQPVCFSYV